MPPGEDLITNTALKYLPKKATLYLTHIINGCIGYFPNEWKIATIITIPKPGKDPSLPKNHRPISLLSFVSYILEKVILNKLINEEEEETILPLTSYYTSRTDIHANLKEKTVAVFLDVEKAFDRVWHGGLLHKLHQICTPPPMVSKLIKSFLKNRKFKVRQGENVSNSHPIRAGVPQGSCLSPSLYLVFTKWHPEKPESKHQPICRRYHHVLKGQKPKKGYHWTAKTTRRHNQVVPEIAPSNKRRENYSGSL